MLVNLLYLIYLHCQFWNFYYWYFQNLF